MPTKVSAGFLLVLATLSAVANTATAQESNRHPATHDTVAIDAEYPPAMHELSFQSGGHKLNGLMYVANGPGPHPTVVLLHGYAGNERNLDLAQALRRAGSNVLYFNYRGSWGSGGPFSVANALEDVARAVALARDPAWAAAHRSDPARVALVGHSFGGFVGAVTTASDPDITCFAFLAGANVGPFGRQAAADPEFRGQLASMLGADMDAEGGPIRGDAHAMVSEIVDQAEAWDLTLRAPALATRPLLLVAGTRDEAVPPKNHHQPLLAALHEAGARHLTDRILEDDHSFSASRIALTQLLVDWQTEACWPDK
ncbi:alpha/beta hydrolase family protein [Elongatibacter sediminis]|uniref:Alpha/beta fold hydrolase n=1 Tax=Elongatibacter sediminis TaxID=3119006 RepID=A0AAW9R6U1_9GAMM